MHFKVFYTYNLICFLRLKFKDSFFVKSALAFKPIDLPNRIDSFDCGSGKLGGGFTPFIGGRTLFLIAIGAANNVIDFPSLKPFFLAFSTFFTPSIFTKTSGNIGFKSHQYTFR